VALPGRLAAVMTTTDPPPGSPSARPRRADPRPPGPNAVLGRYGEALAVRYLREQGMEVLDRNWRCAHGEVDVVARDGSCLVICEVKTRRSAGFGEPVEAVTVAKARRLRRLAAAYLAGRGEGAPVGQVRIDVVGILCRPGRPAVVRHVVGVGS
jgi:putative endonuclease